MDPIRIAAQGVQSLGIEGLPERLPVGAPSQPSAFGRALDAAIDSVSRVQSDADEATRMFALGKEPDLHTVLLQVEKADLAFHTLMEVRNKLLEAYREVMRMQI